MLKFGKSGIQNSQKSKGEIWILGYSAILGLNLMNLNCLLPVQTWITDLNLSLVLNFQLVVQIELAVSCSATYLKFIKLSPWFINKENKIYIRVEFTRKKCKTGILLYCFHTAGVLHIFLLYNLLGPGPSFYRKSKIIVKRKPNYEIGWFHNWPIIISHGLCAVHFMIFRYNYKSNDVFYSSNSL